MTFYFTFIVQAHAIVIHFATKYMGESDVFRELFAYDDPVLI